MEQIVIEVGDETAKNWQNAPPRLREHLNRSFEKQIDELSRQSKLESFDEVLKRISEQAKANGFTEEILQEILNEGD